MSGTRMRDKTAADQPGAAPRTGGFTLIEMAITVAIFGLMVGGGLLGVSVWLEKQAMDETREKLDRIERAITLHVMQTGCIPCPYDPSAATPGTMIAACDGAGPGVAVGLVPYRELGLQRTDSLDGWRRYIDLTVDLGFVTAANGTCPAGSEPLWSGGGIDALTNYGANALDGLIRVLDQTGTAPDDGTVADGTASPIRAAYALVSHGSNGLGAYVRYNSAARPSTPPAGAVSELENTDDEHIFASEIQTGTDTAEFDDIVRARTAAQIIQDAQ